MEDRGSNWEQEESNSSSKRRRGEEPDSWRGHQQEAYWGGHSTYHNWDTNYDNRSWSSSPSGGPDSWSRESAKRKREEWPDEPQRSPPQGKGAHRWEQDGQSLGLAVPSTPPDCPAQPKSPVANQAERVQGAPRPKGSLVSTTGRGQWKPPPPPPTGEPPSRELQTRKGKSDQCTQTVQCPSHRLVQAQMEHNLLLLDTQDVCQAYRFYVRLCPICYVEEPTVVTHPCNHLVYCATCHRDLDANLEWDRKCYVCCEDVADITIVRPAGLPSNEAHTTHNAQDADKNPWTQGQHRPSKVTRRFQRQGGDYTQGQFVRAPPGVTGFGVEETGILVVD